jgi:predicted Zn finger-like uncharacterized protein
MIIICKECSTKFKLDESLLKEAGSQVRCSVCKSIFNAYPTQASGKTGATQTISTPPGYFDSEEELGTGGVGAFQKAAPEQNDDDGLELDVEEDDDDMDLGGLDLGDDDTEFDDGGIDMGNSPGMDAGMNFDEDMDTGLSDMGFDADSGMDDMDLETDINLNLDKGEDIDLDVESDLKKDSVEPEIELPDLGTDSEKDDTPDDEEDFEFEFELEEEEGFDIEDDVTLDIPSDDTEQDEQPEDDLGIDDGDFELSIFDDEDLDKEEETTVLDDIEEETTAAIAAPEKDAAPEKEKNLEEDTEFESMELEIEDIDDDIKEDDFLDEDFIDEDFEDDDDYEIDEFDDDDQEYEDDDIIDEEFEEGETLDKKTKKPRKETSKLLKVLLAIVLILGIGYGAFTLTGGFTKGFDLSKINFSMFKNLLNFSSMDEVPVWATINNQSLNGRYITNESSGKLFVITGKITNESTLPINNIEVEGTLIAKGGVVAKKKKVFCGNKIPEGQLSTLNVSNINRILQRKNGEQGANLNIKAKESVPFMVVFSNLPQELENYTVTVASFKRMKQK